jgi:hypothetical protein
VHVLGTRSAGIRLVAAEGGHSLTGRGLADSVEALDWCERAAMADDATTVKLLRVADVGLWTPARETILAPNATASRSVRRSPVDRRGSSGCISGSVSAFLWDEK